MTIGRPTDRADRLIVIAGERSEDLFAEYSRDAGQRWHPATIYAGTTVDEWRPCSPLVWNRGVLEGRLPAGDQACTWNYFFDVPTTASSVMLRLRSAGGDLLLEQAVDLSGARDVLVIDRRNVAELAGGALPAPWQLRPEGHKTPVVASIFCPADDVTAPALVLDPGVEGWHSIYVGIEPYSAFQLSVSAEGARHPIPDYLNSPRGPGKDRLLQEFYVKSADLTGQDIRLAIGGARQGWRDASISHIRLVPMSADEVARHRRVRELAETGGRPFAGYMEQVTAAYYEPAIVTLLGDTRNEMRLHKERGCTDVYIHVVRLGVRAWYHSDVIERESLASEAEFRAAADQTRAVFGATVRADANDPVWQQALKWAAWMEQGDPLAVAIEQGRRLGMRVFADMGMNVTHIVDAPQLTEAFVREHPEYLSENPMYLDYREQAVQDYAVAVATELLGKYDLDGINLDFARWGYRNAFDHDSLVAVVRRISEERRRAEARLGHPVLIAARIPSYAYGNDASWAERSYGGDHEAFVSALRVWATEGCINRVMACSMSESRRPELSVERYLRAIEGTDVELWGDLYWQGFDTPRSRHLDIARRWADEGLGGGFFFYAHHRPTEFEHINWMLRLIDFPDVRVEP